jgi:methylenetetrahydrofolate dehydrogenase (NADP+) / methenyltetrahydrofolate cyclohydrolase
LQVAGGARIVSAQVIDGKAVAATVREDVAREVEAFRAAHGGVPGLATVLVGDDPASHVYVGNKIRACEEVGIRSIHHELDGATPQDELLDLIAELNGDDAVDGILVQMPLPDQLDQDAVVAALDPGKDVDGLTATSAGLLAQGRPGLVPCTPQGVMELLRVGGVEVQGAEAVIVGRSILVGRPLAALLTNASATVTVCHSRTRDLGAVCSRADILVAAVGSPEMVRGEWVKPGAAVIDVGINRTADGLVGDVEFEAAAKRAAVITPVPGGVGPMTIAMLLRNTVRAASVRRRDSGLTPV